MRIIGGTLRGRKLSNLKGKAIRPTADRLRESIFNIIRRQVPNANVLDLFSGTGAYGIEALSRGGQSAVFIDNSRLAVSIISRNLKLFQLETSAKVIRWDITTGLNCLSNYGSLFNLVFMDPPYNRNLVSVSLRHLQALPILSSGNLIVVEHSLKEPISNDTMNLKLTDQRRYGKSLVSILECVL